MKRKRRILIVDGYNLIGADKELNRESKASLELVREKMLSKLAEYQSVSNYEIICVFDAYEVKSNEAVEDHYGVTVVYTKEKETADEYIERFVSNNYHPILCEINVVTSDLSEQNNIFAMGAYRTSSREMWMNLRDAEKNISRKVEAINQKLPRQKINISSDLRAELEKWRRDEK